MNSLEESIEKLRGIDEKTYTVKGNCSINIRAITAIGESVEDLVAAKEALKEIAQRFSHDKVLNLIFKGRRDVFSALEKTVEKSIYGGWKPVLAAVIGNATVYKSVREENLTGSLALINFVIVSVMLFNFNWKEVIFLDDEIKGSFEEVFLDKNLLAKLLVGDAGKIIRGLYRGNEGEIGRIGLEISKARLLIWLWEANKNVVDLKEAAKIGVGGKVFGVREYFEEKNGKVGEK